MWLFFFFFQAEDGIRDLTVTGVQTCALPISGPPRADGGDRPRHDGRHQRTPGAEGRSRRAPDDRGRSEEHTSELQSQSNLVCRLLLEKKKNNRYTRSSTTAEDTSINIMSSPA